MKAWWFDGCGRIPGLFKSTCTNDGCSKGRKTLNAVSTRFDSEKGRPQSRKLPGLARMPSLPGLYPASEPPVPSPALFLSPPASSSFSHSPGFNSEEGPGIRRISRFQKARARPYPQSALRLYQEHHHGVRTYHPLVPAQLSPEMSVSNSWLMAISLLC